MKSRNITIGILAALLLLFVIYSIVMRGELYKTAKENLILKDDKYRIQDSLETMKDSVVVLNSKLKEIEKGDKIN